MKTDSIFYQLFQTFPNIFFELIGEANVEVSRYEFKSVEIKQTAFRIDGVFLPDVNLSNQLIYFVYSGSRLDAVHFDFDSYSPSLQGKGLGVRLFCVLHRIEKRYKFNFSKTLTSTIDCSQKFSYF